MDRAVGMDFDGSRQSRPVGRPLTAGGLRSTCRGPGGAVVCRRSRRYPPRQQAPAAQPQGIGVVGHDLIAHRQDDRQHHEPPAFGRHDPPYRPGHALREHSRRVEQSRHVQMQRRRRTTKAFSMLACRTCGHAENRQHCPHNPAMPLQPDHDALRSREGFGAGIRINPVCQTPRLHSNHLGWRLLLGEARSKRRTTRPETRAF